MSRIVLFAGAALLALGARAVSPSADTFGPIDNPADQIRAFWHPSESFYTNLFRAGINTLIVHHSGEYRPQLERCPNAVTAERRKMWLDVFEQEGVGMVEKLTLAEGFGRANMFPKKTSRGVGRGVDASSAAFRTAARKGVDCILARIPEKRSLFGVQPSSEVRDSSAPIATDEFDAAFREATGLARPAQTDERQPPVLTRLKDFPIGHVLDDDYPLFRFYTWFWKTGDGWNRYQSDMLAAFQSRFAHPVAGFYDPLVRTPPIWGSGGDVTFGNHWIYPYPNPYKVAYIVSEQQAMARGNPGQGVTTMLQGISYRSAIAPVETTPKVHPRWHDEFPNTRYPTTPAALLREALWTALARKIDGVMFFAGAALFDLSAEGKNYDEYRKRNYYQFTDPTAWPTVEGILRDVAVPLGPMLRALPERPMEVAVVESAAAAIFARTCTWGNGLAIADAAVLAGYPVQALYEEEIVSNGIPASVRVLLMPKCSVMTRAGVKAIAAWQLKGGAVLADRELVPAILPDGLLPQVETSSDAVTHARNMRQAAKEFAHALAPYCVPPARTTENLFTWVRTTRAADYVFAINDRRGPGDYVGVWKRVLDRGLPNEGTVRISRRAGAVYDLVRHEAVPFSLEGGETVIPVSYTTNDGRILLVVAQALAPLEARLHRQAGAVELTVSSRDTGVMIPVRIDWEGAKKPFYAVVKDGLWTGTLAGCGAASVTITNLADGKSLNRSH